MHNTCARASKVSPSTEALTARRSMRTRVRKPSCLISRIPPLPSGGSLERIGTGVLVLLTVYRHSWAFRSMSAYSALPSSPGRRNTSGARRIAQRTMREPFVAVHRSKDFGQPFQFGSCSKMFPLNWGNAPRRSLEGSRWERPVAMTYRITCPQFLAPDGPLESAPALYTTDHSQQLWCKHFGNRSRSNPRKDVALEAPDDTVTVSCGPGCRIFYKPLPRHHFETVCSAVGMRQL